MRLYQQYILNKNGVNIYFVPVIMYPYSSSIWACKKYDENDIPAFSKIEINEKMGEDKKIRKTKLDNDIAKFIIESLFDGSQTSNILMGWKNGNK